MLKNIIKTILGLNIVSFQKIGSGPKAFIKACQNAFTAAHTSPNLNLISFPVEKLENILGKEEEIMLGIGTKEDGALPYNQAVALLALLKKQSPKNILEIGTFLGHTTKLMAKNIPSATIYTIDLPQEYNQTTDTTPLEKDDFHLITNRKVGREFLGTIYEKQIRQIFCDTAHYDFKTITDTIDFFFIDGSHTYDYCKNDTEKCLEVAGKGALFVWHDCDMGHPGVVNSLYEFKNKGYEIKIIEGTPLAFCKIK